MTAAASLGDDNGEIYQTTDMVLWRRRYVLFTTGLGYSKLCLLFLSACCLDNPIPSDQYTPYTLLFDLVCVYKKLLSLSLFSLHDIHLQTAQEEGKSLFFFFFLFFFSENV